MFRGVDVSLKVGVLLSKFETKLNSTMQNRNESFKIANYTWGVAPGIGVSKQVGPIMVGFDYSYQMYQPVKASAFRPSGARVVHGVNCPRYYSRC